jgi:DNA helicase-2/ATP-dependent DNA helicase PcrA
VKYEEDPTKPAPEDGLLIATFHSAKGLEFDTVFVVGCEDGVIPDKRAISAYPVRNAEKKLLEERRALYVALTRAAKEVVITWDTSKGLSLSRFLPALDSPVWKPPPSDLRRLEALLEN